MSRPGTIVTFSSLATAVVGFAVSSGAARLTNATPEPATAVTSTVASSPSPDVIVVSNPIAEVAPVAIATPVLEPLPEIAFKTSTPAESVEAVTVPVAEPAPTASESAGRRRPGLVGLATEGGMLVGDDHTPRIGEVRYFNGRPIRAVRSMRMRVTAYSPDHRSCGMHADGITASGYSVDVNGGRLVAADRRLFPFGALVSVPGYSSGQVVPVLDRGGAIKGSRLDVLYPTQEIARRGGVQHVDVMVWEYADGEPIGFKRPRGR